jgi:hypothetical protein
MHILQIDDPKPALADTAQTPRRQAKSRNKKGEFPNEPNLTTENYVEISRWARRPHEILFGETNPASSRKQA